MLTGNSGEARRGGIVRLAKCEARHHDGLRQQEPERAAAPVGNPKGVPVVDTSVSSNNLPMTTVLHTRGWKASSYRLLLPNDYFQIGYRLHRVCEVVNSDASGNAELVIWPSLREQPADGTALVLNRPKGVFRLNANRRPVQASATRLTTLSFACTEVR